MPDATFSDSNVHLDAGSDGARPDSASDSSVPPPMCLPGLCDPRMDDGCTGELVCVLVGAQASCSVAAGDLEAGDSCESTTECGQGGACFATLEGGVCGRICCPGDDAACERGERCGGSPMLIDGTHTGWGHCVRARRCELLAPDACDPGEGCYIVSPEGATECQRAGEAIEGEACEAQSDCIAGLFCGGLNLRTCQRICRLEEAAACGPSADCVAYSHSPEGTGLCTRDQSYP